MTTRGNRWARATALALLAVAAALLAGCDPAVEMTVKSPKRVDQQVTFTAAPADTDIVISGVKRLLGADGWDVEEAPVEEGVRVTMRRAIDPRRDPAVAVSRETLGPLWLRHRYAVEMVNPLAALPPEDSVRSVLAGDNALTQAPLNVTLDLPGGVTDPVPGEDSGQAVWPVTLADLAGESPRPPTFTAESLAWRWWLLALYGLILAAVLYVVWPLFFPAPEVRAERARRAAERREQRRVANEAKRAAAEERRKEKEAAKAAKQAEREAKRAEAERLKAEREAAKAAEQEAAEREQAEREAAERAERTVLDTGADDPDALPPGVIEGELVEEGPTPANPVYGDPATPPTDTDLLEAEAVTPGSAPEVGDLTDAPPADDLPPLAEPEAVPPTRGGPAFGPVVEDADPATLDPAPEPPEPVLESDLIPPPLDEADLPLPIEDAPETHPVPAEELDTAITPAGQDIVAPPLAVEAPEVEPPVGSVGNPLRVKGTAAEGEDLPVSAEELSADLPEPTVDDQAGSSDAAPAPEMEPLPGTVGNPVVSQSTVVSNNDADPLT